MFVKLHLFLICAYLLNISESSTEGSSDCGDLISCVGAWIGELLVNDKKNVPIRQVQGSHVLSAMGDILTDLSSLIVDTFKNITKDKALIQNALNKTVIDVQSFTINDTDMNLNRTSEKIKVILLDAIEESNKELNGTNNFNNKTEKENDWKLSTEELITVTETDVMSATNVPNGFTTTNILNKMKSNESEESFNVAFTENILRNKTKSPEIDFKLNDRKTFEITLKNQTETKSESDNDWKLPTEELITVAEVDYLSTTNVPNSYTIIDILNEMKPKESEEPSKVAFTEDYIENNTKTPEIDLDQFVVSNNVPFSHTKEMENEINVIPLITSNSNVNSMSNNKVQKGGNTFILKRWQNIPEKVTNKYKIIYETPINATYLETQAKDETYIAQNGTMSDTNILNDLHNLLEIERTKKQPQQPTALNQTTNDYINNFESENFTHFELVIKEETNLKEPVTFTQTKNVGNDLKNQNFTYTKNETSKDHNLKKSSHLNKTKKHEVHNNTENHFDVYTILENKLRDVNFFTQPTNYDNHPENQNPHENEIPVYGDFNYNIEDENGTDYLEIDYIALYKDATVPDVAYTPPTYIPPDSAPVTPDEVIEYNGIESIFPWIATLFIKNNNSDQFEYICDGVVVSERVVLTAARCLSKSNVTVEATNVVVILGKRSLQAMEANEKVLTINNIKLHEKFTDKEGKVDNDLAIIVLDETLEFNEDIQRALLTNEDDDDEIDAIQSATTGWHIMGGLTPIYFDEVPERPCVKNTESVNTFCASFRDGVSTCPSFGGLFVSRNDIEWRLQGITTGKPTNKGVCFDKSITFTNISHYFRWIMDNINMNKGY